MLTTNLTFTPYGGVAEIGSNMGVVEFGDYTLVIDAGILFPHEDNFGINYLIPDWHKLKNAKNLILFITHGHEDHIGAITHFIKEIKPQLVYAPAFAFELILAKIEMDSAPTYLKEYSQGNLINFGKLEIIPFQVNHSIPDTFGVIVKDCNANALIYVSDFKFSNEGYLEPEIDFTYINKTLTDSKRKIAFFDSTNILNKGKTASELSLIHDLENVFQLESRLFFTLFASNIFRIQTILNLCHKYNKKLVPVGKSVEFYLRTANKLHLLSNANCIDDIDNADTESRDNVYVLSGSQGDFFGALRRVAASEHPRFTINKNDTFIFSSKAIPGNEKKIYRIYNQLSDLGANIITSSDMNIHASGHASQKDLDLMIQNISPTHYIPIHGESFFLKRHIHFINSSYPQIKTYSLRNHDTLEIAAQITVKNSTEALAPRLIYGKGTEIQRKTISERRKIAESGIIIVSISRLKKSFELSFNGVEQSDNYVDTINKCIQNHLQAIVSEPIGGKENLRIALRRKSKDVLGIRPIAVVHVLE